MRYNGSLSNEEKQELYEAACENYQRGELSLNSFKNLLADLGYNATDIAEAEKFYRPEPPENEDGC